MRESEQRARAFYAEPIRLDSNEFVQMMLLDSCFIVELLRQSQKPNEPIYPIGQIESAIKRDLVLFENQLPFFIVKKLFDMTKNSADSDLICMFIKFFERIIGWITPVDNLVASSVIPREDDIRHLLGLLHYCCCYQFHSIVSRRHRVKIKDFSIKSAIELHEVGIKFNKITGRDFFDVRFVNGTMEIPTFEVEDSTESVFRNLIAYEQYLPDTSWNHFTAYRTVMDHLVNTSKDVEILTDREIIFNLLGDTEVVAAMINKLGNNIMLSYEGYEEVYNNVNEHCRGKWNLWLAILTRKYFNNPWALISFLAAVVLLLLTVLQTIFAIHPVGKSN